jgi:hypothetical protein
MRVLIAFFVVILLVLHSFAEIIHVPENQETIQDGIGAAEDGDTVLVQPGEYVENISFEGKAITVASLILTTGDIAYIDSTIIDGNEQNSVVRFTNEEDSTSVLQGFTIRNGEAEDGGGIYCNQASPIISNCIIEANYANNFAGGIRAVASDLRITRCIIRNNNAGSCGGAFHFTGSNPVINHCVILYNRSEHTSVFEAENSIVTFSNCTISRNSGEGRGGLFYLYRESISDFNNCIIWDNSPGDAVVDRGSSLSFAFTDYEGGMDNIEGAGLNWGEGNIDEDPIFVDPDEGDYHLTIESPCINAGDPDANPDPDGSRADMGAYPFSHGGVVEGYVLDALNDEPLENAKVSTSFGIVDTTDEDGYFKLAYTPSEEFDITSSKLDYIDSTLIDQSVELNDTLELVFELLHPTLTPSIERITVELNQEERTNIDFSIGNDGNGLLEWSVKLRLVGESDVDQWELRQSYNVGQIVDDSRLQGVVYIDGLFYVTGYGNDINSIYVLNREGELVHSFPQFGDSRLGMKDLAFDGELIWGVAEETVYGFNTAGDSIISFEGPFNRMAAIAWDSDRELLWISGVTTDIHGYNRLGGHDQENEISRHGLTIYGLAYWPEDPDGYQLYVFHHPEVNSQVVHKMNIETSDTLFVSELSPEGGGHPEGAFIMNEYDLYGNWVFMDIANDGDDDRIDIWQLQQANTSWMQVEPVAGRLNPGEEQELVLTLDASGLDSTLEWQGELIFSKAVGGDDTVIPVTLTIASEDDVGNYHSELPETFGITSIYPNPFNSMTTIVYSLPKSGFAKLTLFDIYGRELESLLNEKQQAGQYQISINCCDLASGLYFIRLEGSGQSFTQKIMLVK